MFLKFVPIKSCLGDLTPLTQVTELLLAELIKDGFFISHFFTREREVYRFDGLRFWQFKFITGPV